MKGRQTRWKFSVWESFEGTSCEIWKSNIKNEKNIRRQINEKWKYGGVRDDRGILKDPWKVSCKRKKREERKDNHDEKRASMIASSFYVAYKSFSGHTNYVAHPWPPFYILYYKLPQKYHCGRKKNEALGLHEVLGVLHIKAWYCRILKENDLFIRNVYLTNSYILLEWYVSFITLR